MRKSISTIIAFTLTQKIAFADKLVIPKPDTLPGPIGAENASNLRTWFVETLLPGWTTGMIELVGMVALVMLIASGIRYLTAYTNEEAATGAKKMLIASAVGLILAVFSYTIVAIISNLVI